MRDREAAVAERLSARYPADRWGLVRHVRTAPGVGVEGLRIADICAIALWPSMGPCLEVIEIKCSDRDMRFEIEHPQKSAPFLPYASARWFAVPAPWQRILTSKSLLP